SRRLSNPGERASIMQLLQYEAQRTVQRDPELNRVLDQGLSYSPEPSRHWFRFVNQISNNMLRHLAKHVTGHFQGVNPFDFFHTLGSGGALYTLLVPYFAAYANYSRNRHFSREVHQRFNGERNMPPAPRLGHFTDTFEEVNGVARTLQKQVELAGRTGKNLTMITAPSPDSGMERMAGVHYIKPIDTINLPEYQEQNLYIPPVMELIQMAYDMDFTHIHAATPGPIGLTALAIARLMKLPFITTYHTAMPQYARVLTDDPAIEEITWRFMLWFYDQSTIIFAPSEETANELIGRGISESKIRLMPRGIDTKRFHPRFKKNDIDLPGGLRLLYVGRVSKEKNLPMLCRAFKRLSEEYVNAHLIVVGEGPYLEDMKKEMDGAPCCFTGYLEGETLASVYASCDMFLFPSTTDTFGNVVLEAQASGIPVIVSDSGGPQENLIDGETGIITHADDEQSFLSAMRALCGNPSRLEQMKIAARQYAQERDIEQAFEEYWQFYCADMEPAAQQLSTRNSEEDENKPHTAPSHDPFADLSARTISAAPAK
ncbi:MAG: glycosyltransferase family 4 protein, partial [Candidatus Sumerlaeota bacterium]